MQSEKRSANIKDVAALAKVSTATVSRFLNGNLDRMSAATAERVRVAIDKLKYVPNSAARQMTTKTSNLIALIVSNSDDYFSAELFKGMSSILESNGYIATMLDSDSDPEREEKLISAVNNHTFDGLVLQPIETTRKIESIMQREAPIVVVDREMTQAPWPQVVINNFDAAREAATYFVDKGYTHFIVLTSDLMSAVTRRERYRGILTAAHNVDVLEVSEKSYNHKKINEELISLIKKSNERTVIFALKERWLLEFIPNLAVQGYVDNQQVTATGFADTIMARQIEPRMKLISQNPFLLGASAAEVMVHELKQPGTSNEDVITVPAKFE
ncbi:LacI family DNA-binding transcriptional regulator [Pediococcus acidilactici]|jgi:LacI family kdg operon repressor|uniref:LacI family DNA-binding transcriptional regulator n=1 Tax=Pediococcus acidilactici TaxID=1254 RepID=UPI000FEF0529|nr:LacI family DNA-binding transcriptional regulator [Pediococcus acidilactici]RWY85887.1 LacI family transcriptional regulator [Pediococcus acidilactici]